MNNTNKIGWTRHENIIICHWPKSISTCLCSFSLCYFHCYYFLVHLESEINILNKNVTKHTPVKYLQLNVNHLLKCLNTLCTMQNFVFYQSVPHTWPLAHSWSYFNYSPLKSYYEYSKRNQMWVTDDIRGRNHLNCTIIIKKECSHDL